MIRMLMMANQMRIHRLGIKISYLLKIPNAQKAYPAVEKGQTYFLRTIVIPSPTGNKTDSTLVSFLINVLVFLVALMLAS